MPTINAGASTAITVAVGTYLEGTGAGMAVLGPAAVVEPLTAGDAWQIGPFDRATLVSITAGSAITYTVKDNMRDPSEADKLPLATVSALSSLVSRAGIVATDTGTAWLGAPSLLSFSAVLDSGTTTAVLLEVRDAAGAVSTAATITADTVAQVMRQALLLRQNSEYRFRRVSGTGTVTITV